jgi:predicted anti-sigma-YlaC factor YlaD
LNEERADSLQRLWSTMKQSIWLLLFVLMISIIMGYVQGWGKEGKKKCCGSYFMKL